MNPEALAFDREFTLAELLRGVPRESLTAALEALLGPGAGLTDAAGAPVCGAPAAGAARAPLALEIEPLGHLAGDATRPRDLAAVARLLTLLLDARRRYLMVSDLHTEAVRADYLELQRRHAALQDSEERYRGLAEALERRVAEQVAIIDEKQRQLYQAEKLASIGQLAAGVAHEINNPVGFVRSNLATAQGYLHRFAEFAARPGDSEAAAAAWRALDLDFVVEDFAALVTESIEGLDRVTRIVRDLKGFSSVDKPEEEVVDLNDNLASVCSVVAGRLPEGVRIERRFAPLPRLLCLPGHLNQVFLNLLTNALQAVGEAGEIVVATQADQGEIRVRIADSGPGIAPELRSRIFEPFFTTREVGQGTGLGLTVARDIVQAHGGRIELDCAPGAGAAFTVCLPV